MWGMQGLVDGSWGKGDVVALNLWLGKFDIQTVELVFIGKKAKENAESGVGTSTDIKLIE